MREHFSELLSVAADQLLLHPLADQAVAVKTKKGLIHHFANDLSAGPRDEVHFVQQLRNEEDATVSLLVCMWSDQSIDLPSMHLRKLLLEADPENEHTLMLLQTVSGPMTRTIGRSMP